MTNITDSSKSRAGPNGIDPRNNPQHAEYLDDLHTILLKNLHDFIKVSMNSDRAHTLDTYAECATGLSADQV